MFSTRASFRRCLQCPLACLRLTGLFLIVQFVSLATGENGATLRPIFKPTPQNVTFGVGERAILRCRVENLGNRTITWRRRGETHPLTIGQSPFAQDPRLSVDCDAGTVSEWSLSIDGVQADDAGVYLCQVTVKTDPNENSYAVQLNVKTVHLTGTEYVELGSPIRLLCNASGSGGGGGTSPPPRLEWFFEDRPIDSDVTSGLFITTKLDGEAVHSQLLIGKSSARHQGVYDCRTPSGDGDSMVVHVLNDFLMNQRNGKHDISAERIIGDDDGRKTPKSAAAAAADRLPISLSIWLGSSIFIAASYDSVF